MIDMFKSEIVYREQTLYVDLVGVCSSKNIKSLQKKLYKIIDQYGVNDIVINKKGIISLDGNAFYNMLDDYDTKYGGKLIVDD